MALGTPAAAGKANWDTTLMLVTVHGHTVLWSTAPRAWNWPWWQYSWVHAELHLSGAPKNSPSHPKVALKGARLGVRTQDTQSQFLSTAHS